MSISRTHTSPINEISAAVPVKGPGLKTNGLSFKEMLSNTATSSNRPFNDRPPLSKAELMEIVNTIHSHMKSRLIRALSSDMREETDIRIASLFDRLIPPDPESSKKYHSTQNNDVFNVRDDLDLTINEAAEAEGVDPALVKSVIKVESNFNPESTSPKGAMGLMQLMPDTAKDLGVHNAYNPVENVRAGTRYLKALLKRYGGDVNLALAAYNWGMGNLEKRPGQMPLETRNYIENVKRYYEQAKA